MNSATTRTNGAAGDEPRNSPNAEGDSWPLSARALKKSFGGVEAVQNFHHDLEPRVVTGLIGPNGAGKTTIFNLLAGRIHPDSGDVFLGDERITGKAVHTICRLGLGRSFQEVRLFGSLSCLDNCAVYAQRGPANSLWGNLFLPRPALRHGRAAVDAARQALTFVGLERKAATRARSLSYAEQKLLSIARLLAMGAETFLLDEPASGLDRNGITILISAIHRLVEEGKTVMLIEHNLDVVRESCHKVLFLDRGAVLAEGPPETVFAQSELAEIYFGA
jgi:ABC-type branched-subunit amino acid transport system ATPase component